MSEVLILNSYAGSLTLAATQLGLRTRGSYEDAGFGLRTQRLNFPTLHYVERLPWPAQDLTGVTVIAHPPCAAFSLQNSNNHVIHGKKQYTGPDTDAFGCTKRVMDYALSQGCEALAVESVVGALEGGRAVHDAHAARHGYHVYRILQNALDFGVPQQRPRFWAIFTKWAPLVLSYKPRHAKLSDVLMAQGTLVPEQARFWERTAARGWPRARVLTELLDGEVPGRLLQVTAKRLGLDDGSLHFKRAAETLGIGTFEAGHPRALNPDGAATTLMHNSWWFAVGRALYREEYLRIMGFPADYQFHPGDVKQFRKYLSKGVCPPVAKWLLANLTGAYMHEPGETTFVLKSGETLDLREKHGPVAPKTWAGTAVPRAKAPAVKAKRAPTRWRMAATLSDDNAEYANKLAVVETHNAMVMRCLNQLGGEATFNELYAQAQAFHWQTTAKQPRNIFRFHLDQLTRLGLVLKGALGERTADSEGHPAPAAGV